MKRTSGLLKMTCEEFSEAATAGHEFRPGIAGRIRYAWHWIICVYCRRFARQWQHVRSALRLQVPEERMPDQMRIRIRKNLEKRH